MKAIILTEQEVRFSETRDYNPSEWDRVIDRVMKYSDVVWYCVPRGNGYSYDRYYAEYTLPDGLRLASSISYSYAITSGGFYRFDVDKLTDDGRTLIEVRELLDIGYPYDMKEIMKQLKNTKHVDISFNPFFDGDGNKVLFSATPSARAEMIERSKKYGVVFTKGL